MGTIAVALVGCGGGEPGPPADYLDTISQLSGEVISIHCVPEHHGSLTITSDRVASYFSNGLTRLTKLTPEELTRVTEIVGSRQFRQAMSSLEPHRGLIDCSNTNAIILGIGSHRRKAERPITDPSIGEILDFAATLADRFDSQT